MISMNTGMVGRFMPRNRRFHEGRFYNFQFKDYLKKFKRKKKVYDFFKGSEIPENTQDSKFLKFNDEEGVYDKNGFDNLDWGVDDELLEAIIMDFSVLTQNYILGVEGEKCDKIANFLIQIFGLLVLGIPILYIVFEIPLKTVIISLTIAVLIFITSLILKKISSKRKLKTKDYIKKLEEIAIFYNSNILQEKKVKLSQGSKGAYISFIRHKENFILAPNQDFYEITGVGFDPYNEDLAVEEKKEEEVKKNWRDLRRDGEKKNDGEYAWAENRRPGGGSGIGGDQTGGGDYRILG